MLDVLVIGSGPAGLSASVYAKRANLEVTVVEKMYMGTGQVAESTRVDNYLGLLGINGFDLGDRFRRHAEELGVTFREGNAVSFAQENGIWKVSLEKGEVIETRTVIYAAGAVHRHLGIEGEVEFGGKGVSYCATCDGAFFRNKTTAVIGGGDTALDDALYLSDLCKKVVLVHRRDAFRGSIRTVEQLRQKDNVEFRLNARPSRIGGANRLEELVLEDGTRIAVDGVFIAVGMVPMTEQVKTLVDLDQGGYIVADESGITTAPGFFAAGDVRTKPLRQVVTAVSDGANAATSAERYIRSGMA